MSGWFAGETPADPPPLRGAFFRIRLPVRIKCLTYKTFILFYLHLQPQAITGIGGVEESIATKHSMRVTQPLRFLRPYTDIGGASSFKYSLTANVSTNVKYVNTFACQTYLHKIVVLCISDSTCQKWIGRAQLSYVNSSDTQMYWHIFHMWKHMWSMHIYLNILNMLKDS